VGRQFGQMPCPNGEKPADRPMPRARRGCGHREAHVHGVAWGALVEGSSVGGAEDGLHDGYQRS
jgi:hypothetical protein